MRSEAEALTENILKIVDKEIDELKEKIAELEHEVENLKEANDRHNSQPLS
jgi:FtsZ-binding cell division protein ZapB